MNTPEEPQERAEETIAEDMPDMDVSGQDAESVKGGMTKQEFVQQVPTRSGLTRRDAGKAVDAF